MKDEQKVPAIVAEGVTKRFGRVTALEDVSMRVPKGAVTALLGDNGAGKSTLIKILSGVFLPTQGELQINGISAKLRNAMEARERGISTVFQDLAIIPGLSIWRNFFLGAEPGPRIGPFHMVNKRHAREATAQAMADIGIRVRNPNEPAGNLSGGERQAVAISRALFFGAHVLILDEPTSAMAVGEVEKVFRAVEKARKQDVAIVFITHNIHHAYRMADFYTILEHGRVCAQYARGEVTEQELIDIIAEGADTHPHHTTP